MEQKLEHHKKRERIQIKQPKERAKRTLHLVTISEIKDPTAPSEDYISE